MQQGPHPFCRSTRVPSLPFPFPFPLLQPFLSSSHSSHLSSFSLIRTTALGRCLLQSLICCCVVTILSRVLPVSLFCIQDHKITSGSTSLSAFPTDSDLSVAANRRRDACPYVSWCPGWLCLSGINSCRAKIVSPSLCRWDNSSLIMFFHKRPCYLKHNLYFGEPIWWLSDIGRGHNHHPGFHHWHHRVYCACHHIRNLPPGWRCVIWISW